MSRPPRQVNLTVAELLFASRQTGYELPVPELRRAIFQSSRSLGTERLSAALGVLKRWGLVWTATAERVGHRRSDPSAGLTQQAIELFARDGVELTIRRFCERHEGSRPLGMPRRGRGVPVRRAKPPRVITEGN